MDRVFSYTASGVCSKLNLEFDALCVYFSDRDDLDQFQFYSDLERSLKSASLLPDCVVIIASKKFCESISLHWENTVLRNSFISRGEKSGRPFVKFYYLYSWEKTGFTEVFSSCSDADLKPCFSLQINALVEQGLYELVNCNSVVQVAPVGHLFKHPSGTRNSIFVQARELAKTEPELCFVGRSISLLLGCDSFFQLSVVYIDSMGIYPFVREALDFCGIDARIHSFHSYDEMRKLTPPAANYLVVISASTSGGMARDLQKQQSFENEKIITLVDRTDRNRSGKILISLDRVDLGILKFEAENFETEIELVGEHFSSKAKPPRAVTLGKPHVPAKLKDFLEEFGREGLNPLNKMINGQPRALSLTTEAVADNLSFVKWLTEEINWNLSVAIDALVCTNDVGSISIANRVADLIVERRKGGLRPIVCVYNDEIAWGSISNSTGVLIVTAVARDGGLLREISRDLREHLNPEIDCPRHYLSAVGLPQSKESWIRLKQFLQRNASDRLYGFSEWLVLPIGSDRQSNHWTALAKLASESQVLDIKIGDVDKDIVESSLDMASAAIKDNFDDFLPKSSGESLSLSSGFIYFGTVFQDDLESALRATTYLAISSALQKARDIDDAANQLRSTGYESVILSPECFLRFNDNILHACIIRGCRMGELDYSSSPHHSKLMGEFLIKVFSRHELPYGAAAVEFAAAMATQRLKLKKNDQEKVVLHAIETLKGKPSALLGFLLMTAAPRASLF
ncbi:hypothetical protein [Pseudomonas fluorescens]|uniref:hypothetical protein n=1 Tax=Pseudomonas fluorescens TaxID=294 RepID=UPI001115CEFA|nr:hypothetical protein [Pseudomonas fluorescens]